MWKIETKGFTDPNENVERAEDVPDARVTGTTHVYGASCWLAAVRLSSTETKDAFFESHCFKDTNFWVFLSG